MVVSASPYEHMIGKPDVKYVANMHGNEAVGREMMLHLIHVCLQNQSFYYRISFAAITFQVALMAWVFFFYHWCN